MKLQAVCVLTGLLLAGAACPRSALAETNWPRWRGADGSGHYTATSMPQRWTDANLLWRAELPGSGQSTPIVWEDRIFLTAATDGGRNRQVICLDRKSGKQVWSQNAWNGEPEKLHKMNSHASASCVTDGERVIAFFGKGGLHCYDMDGNWQWSRQLGDFSGPWGTAASPVLVDDLVVQNCDADDQAYLLAVNKKDGKTVWKTPRFVARGWCTPIVVDTGSGREIVLNSEPGMHGYDPVDGKELWFCKVDTGRGTPTVAQYKDLLIAVSGRPGDMVATRSGGRGTVNKSREVWRTKRKGGRDLPSPLVIGEYLFVTNMAGVATCYEAASGKPLDVLRLAGAYSASPIAINDLVYLPNEAGEVLVIKPGPKMQILSRNRVGAADTEIFRASLTPTGSNLLLRSNRVLYCIGS